MRVIYIITFGLIFISCKQRALKCESIREIQKCKDDYMLQFFPKFDIDSNIIFNGLNADFEIYGAGKQLYRLEIKSDTLALLSICKNKHYKLLDSISISLWSITESHLPPSFYLTDFNHDGYQDLVCFVSSNMNGDGFTRIYLNHPEKKSLLPLLNIAESNSPIWCSPVFNKKSKTIYCEDYGSAMGTSSESTYCLVGFDLVPVKKHEQFRQAEFTRDSYFVGKNNEWKLVSEKTTYNR